MAHPELCHVKVVVVVLDVSHRSGPLLALLSEGAGRLPCAWLCVEVVDLVACSCQTAPGVGSGELLLGLAAAPAPGSLLEWWNWHPSALAGSHSHNCLHLSFILGIQPSFSPLLGESSFISPFLGDSSFFSFLLGIGPLLCPLLEGSAFVLSLSWRFLLLMLPAQVKSGGRRMVKAPKPLEVFQHQSLAVVCELLGFKHLCNVFWPQNSFLDIAKGQSGAVCWQQLGRGSATGPTWTESHSPLLRLPQGSRQWLWLLPQQP